MGTVTSVTGETDVDVTYTFEVGILKKFFKLNDRQHLERYKKP